MRRRSTGFRSRALAHAGGGEHWRAELRALLRARLFGHVKGAFTDARADRIGRFELANGGTLFLDEIANIPMRQQAKLLRVLETGELERVGSSTTRKVDVRMLSATNADLRQRGGGGDGFGRTCCFG